MSVKNKTLTQNALRNIINEELKVLKEYEQYVDEDGNVYDDEGNVERRGRSFGDRYGGQTYGGTRQPWRARHGSGSRKSKGKEKSPQELAIEDAMKAKPNNFLKSILSQLQQGRSLSSRQKDIVRKILKKTAPESVSLFEAKSGRK